MRPSIAIVALIALAACSSSPGQKSAKPTHARSSAERHASPDDAKDDAGIGNEAKAVLSPAFRKCFGPDAPLNAESYDCLDTEYRRLDTLLTAEYRAALARQPDEPARNRLLAEERGWWRTRFDHCKNDAGDMQGSTATVITESCEIDTLAERIARLRHA